jgi:hypothetical protein
LLQYLAAVFFAVICGHFVANSEKYCVKYCTKKGKKPLRLWALATFVYRQPHFRPAGGEPEKVVVRVGTDRPRTLPLPPPNLSFSHRHPNPPPFMFTSASSIRVAWVIQYDAVG